MKKDCGLSTRHRMNIIIVKSKRIRTKLLVLAGEVIVLVVLIGIVRRM